MTKDKKQSEQPISENNQHRDRVDYAEDSLSKTFPSWERVSNIDVSPAQPITDNMDKPKPKK